MVSRLTVARSPTMLGLLVLTPELLSYYAGFAPRTIPLLRMSMRGKANYFVSHDQLRVATVKEVFDSPCNAEIVEQPLVAVPATFCKVTLIGLAWATLGR